MMHTALLVVDMQNCFVDDGELGITGGRQLALDIKDYIESHGTQYQLIISSQDWHIDPRDHFSEEPDYIDIWPEHGKAHTYSAELVKELNDIKFDCAIKKGQYSPGYSAFEGHTDDSQSLETYLKEQEIDAIDICGLALSHCVKQSALDAHALGFKTRLLAPLSLAVHQEDTSSILHELKQSGIEIIEA